MRKLVHFLSYHNAVPITLGVLFLSSGVVFAANEEAREFVKDSVVKAQERVVSIDNSYIVNKSLESYSPQVNIVNVTEDEDVYYIEYRFTTIALDDAVWQDVTYAKTMEVKKTALGEYTDLGVYVTEQLKQIVDRELEQLKEVQAIERRQSSSKVVATAYSGLVGQFIDEKTEQLPGYVPRVSEPEAEDVDPVAVARANKSDVPEIARQQSSRNNENDNSGTSQSSGNGPIIELLGANPARISLRSVYSDLGVITKERNTGRTIDLSVQLSLNGKKVSSISIDTSTTSDWSVGYTVTHEGKTSYAERTVVVYDPYAPAGEQAESQNPSSGTTGSSSQGGGTSSDEQSSNESQQENVEEAPDSSATTTSDGTGEEGQNVATSTPDGTPTEQEESTSDESAATTTEEVVEEEVVVEEEEASGDSVATTTDEGASEGDEIATTTPEEVVDDNSEEEAATTTSAE